MTPKTPTLQETAAKGVEALNQIVIHRDQLQAENDRLRVDLALFREKSSQLESRLAQAMAERDHYMRFSTELVTNLNTVRMTIDEAMRAAKAAAFAPAAVPQPKPEPAAVDTARLENLIRRLPVNGGENAGVALK
jgi:chorismate mutase